MGEEKITLEKSFRRSDIEEKRSYRIILNILIDFISRDLILMVNRTGK